MSGVNIKLFLIFFWKILLTITITSRGYTKRSRDIGRGGGFENSKTRFFMLQRLKREFILKIGVFSNPKLQTSRDVSPTSSCRISDLFLVVVRSRAATNPIFKLVARGYFFLKLYFMFPRRNIRVILFIPRAYTCDFCPCVNRIRLLYLRGNTYIMR